ncbi:MAG: hypothetical protein WC319_15310 [Candidatus Paceibacterota bacterium]|jgi:hypothetical protein
MEIKSNETKKTTAPTAAPTTTAVKTVSKEEYEKAIKEGLSMRAMEKKFGIKLYYVQKQLEKYGLKQPARRGIGQNFAQQFSVFGYIQNGAQDVGQIAEMAKTAGEEIDIATIDAIIKKLTKEGMVKTALTVVTKPAPRGGAGSASALDGTISMNSL